MRVSPGATDLSGQCLLTLIVMWSVTLTRDHEGLLATRTVYAYYFTLGAPQRLPITDSITKCFDPPAPKYPFRTNEKHKHILEYEQNQKSSGGAEMHAVATRTGRQYMYM